MNKEDYMTQAELIETLHEKTGLTRSDCRRVYNALWETVQENLRNGIRTNFTGYGYIERRYKKATRKVVGHSQIKDIPAHYLPFFHPGKLLKDTVKDLI